MITLDRTPSERAAFLRDRIATMLAEAFTDGLDITAANCMTSEMYRRLETLVKAAEEAFHAAEARGEKRGRVIGMALSKLSSEERKALGLG